MARRKTAKDRAEIVRQLRAAEAPEPAPGDGKSEEAP